MKTVVAVVAVLVVAAMACLAAAEDIVLPNKDLAKEREPMPITVGEDAPNKDLDDQVKVLDDIIHSEDVGLAFLIPDKILNVYAAPSVLGVAPSARDMSSVRSVYDKPFFAALRAPGKNEMVTFLLKDGLGSLTSLDKVGRVPPPVLRDAPMLSASGTTVGRIGIMLSAARYLQLPEMAMPIARMVLPGNFTLEDVFGLSQEFPSLPWMYLANREDLPPGVLDKLIQVGQFSVSNDKLEVTHDFPPHALPPAIQPSVPTSVMGNQPSHPIVYYRDRFAIPAVLREGQREEVSCYRHPAIVPSKSESSESDFESPAVIHRQQQQQRPTLYRRVFVPSAPGSRHGAYYAVPAEDHV